MRVFWRTAAMMAILAAGIFAPWPALAWTSKKETMTPEEYKAWHAATAKRAICKTNCMRHLYAVDGDSGAHDVYWCAKNWERLVPRCYRAADSDDAGGGGGGPSSPPVAPPVVDATCGADHGGAFASPLQPTNLCAAGILSGGLVGIGPWSWTCDGENGGSSASCSANKVVNGQCGPADGTTVASAPTDNLCTTGTASAVTGTGPWSWTCTGVNGGANASCAAGGCGLPGIRSAPSMCTWGTVIECTETGQLISYEMFMPGCP